MNRIDRYTSFLFWGYFLGGLLIFLTIFLAVDAMSTMVEYKGVSSSTFMQYYIYYVPEVVNKLFPIACLLGTMVTLSNLNKANELVALFASGMSLLRVALPLLFWVIFLSIGNYVLSDRILPGMIREKNFIFYNEIAKKPAMFSVVKTGRIWYRSKNAIFNIKTLNPRTSHAQGLTMYFFNSNWDLLQMLTASDVDMNGNQWSLRDGSVTLFTANSSFPLTSQFKTKSISMGEDTKDLTSTGQTSEMLTQEELSRFIAKNKEAGLDTVRYEVDFQAKYGFALAGLVMSLLGIPFSVGRARSGGIMMNVGIAIGLVFGYWVLYSSSLTLGSHGHMPPILAAWLPNVSMAGFAVYLLKKIKR